ncbi:MAG: hypothetical protein R2838_25670 [Caldilineaceae bacterium]
MVASSWRPTESLALEKFLPWSSAWSWRSASPWLRCADRPTFPRRFLGLVVALTAVSRLVAWLERDRHGGEALAEAMLALLPLLVGRVLLSPVMRRGGAARHRVGASMAVCVVVLLYLRERTIWLALATGIFTVGLVELWLRRSRRYRRCAGWWRIVGHRRSHAAGPLRRGDVDPRALQTDMAQLPGASQPLTLWHDARPIIADYRFSGSLGNAAMVFDLPAPARALCPSRAQPLSSSCDGTGRSRWWRCWGCSAARFWSLQRPWRSSRANCACSPLRSLSLW